MLTKRLKGKELFEQDVRTEESKQDARMMLDEAVEALLIAMVGTENIGTYRREEIENYVLRRMEYYEVLLYGMDEDEFDEYIVDRLAERFANRVSAIAGGLK